MGKSVRSKRKLERRKSIPSDAAGDPMLSFDSWHEHDHAEKCINSGKIPLPAGLGRDDPNFYAIHDHSNIDRVAWFRDALDQGDTVWPGGYSILFVPHDGDWMCFDCAKANASLIEEAIRDCDHHGGWNITGRDIYWEGPIEHCCNCNRDLPSEYGDPDAPDPTEEENGQQILQFNTGG